MSQTVQVAADREVEVEVSGDEDGPVLLWHHGTPGSCHQPAFLASAAHARGWRLVTLSRPGYARSTRHPGRTVADVVPDVVAVVDSLDVDRFFVGGASGGGPHSLATAALLPDRVRAALVVCAVAPYGTGDLEFLAGMGQDNLDEFGAALQGEQPLRSYLEHHLPALRAATAEVVVEQLASLLPPVDRQVLTGELGDDLAASMRHAVSGTADGWVDDDLAFTRSWGFSLATLQVPVSLWQGSEDLMVPFAHGRWLGRHVPGAQVHLEQGEGHLSITVGAVHRMLDELAALAR